jgi:hypothetical protein
MVDAILDDIDRGLPDGRRYTHYGRAKEERQAWRVVQQHCPEKREAQCKEAIRQWVCCDVRSTATRSAATKSKACLSTPTSGQNGSHNPETVPGQG